MTTFIMFMLAYLSVGVGITGVVSDYFVITRTVTAGRTHTYYGVAKWVLITVFWPVAVGVALSSVYRGRRGL